MRDNKSATIPFDSYFKRHDFFECAEEDMDELKTFTPSQIRDRLHSIEKECLDALWDTQCQGLCRIRTLKRLQIDFDDCFCPTGCCRLVSEACDRLGPWDGNDPPTYL